MSTILIGIAGGTGSGKTTLTRHLKEHFGPEVTVIGHDSYYKRQFGKSYEERAKVNYDHPSAFDTELLKLIDFKEVSPECRITPHGNMAMFLWEDEMVFLAPGRFSRENEEKILYIAGMDWENQVEADDPVVNLNLFNADQDEPLLTPEE